MTKKTLFTKKENLKNSHFYTLENEKIKVTIIRLGATITSFIKKDENIDIVLGYDNIKDYYDNPNYFGVTVGRCANRIKDANFFIDNNKIELEKNEKNNHLHGGSNGLHKKNWILTDVTQNSITLKCTQTQDEDFYPGNLTISVKYSIDDNNLSIDYEYFCDKNSIANITNHSYFNLNGAKSNVLSHFLKLNSSMITPTDEQNIPTGEIINVKNTEFDFRKLNSLKQKFEKYKKELSSSKGYDTNFIVDKNNDEISLNAIITNKKLELQIYSDSPCFQLYTGGFITPVTGKNSQNYLPNFGMCIEPQFTPNSINMPNFSSPKILKNIKYKKRIIYKILKYNK